MIRIVIAVAPVFISLLLLNLALPVSAQSSSWQMGGQYYNTTTNGSWINAKVPPLPSGIGALAGNTAIYQGETSNNNDFSQGIIAAYSSGWLVEFQGYAGNNPPEIKITNVYLQPGCAGVFGQNFTSPSSGQVLSYVQQTTANGCTSESYTYTFKSYNYGNYMYYIWPELESYSNACSDYNSWNSYSIQFTNGLVQKSYSHGSTSVPTYSSYSSSNPAPLPCFLVPTSVGSGYVTVNTRSPTITTSLSASAISKGGSAHDSSSISGLSTPAGGTVTYYYSTANSCPASNPTTVNTVAESSGVVPNSNDVTFSNFGKYYWYASFSGDQSNIGATSACELLNVGYYLTMQMTGGGIGSVSPPSGWYNPGTNVQITASAGTGYHFCYWTGSGTGSYSGSNNPANVVMNSAITETATIKLTCPSVPVAPTNTQSQTPAFFFALAGITPVVLRRFND